MPDQKVLQGVGSLLGLHENEGQPLFNRLQQVQQHLALIRRRDVLDHLHDEVGGRSHTPHGQEDVVTQEVRRQPLDLLREGGREQQGLPVADGWHVLSLHDTPDLGLKAHVKHAIGLVQGQKPHVLQGDTGSIDDVNQPSRSRHKEVAAPLELPQLLLLGGPTVHHHRANACLVGELAGLVIDLRCKLTCRGQHQCQRIRLATAGTRLKVRVLQDAADDGEAETRSLSGPSLGASHQIPASDADGNRIALHGRWLCVLAAAHVGHEPGRHVKVLKRLDRLWHIAPGGLDRDIFVGIEVDPGVLASEHAVGLLFDGLILCKRVLLLHSTAPATAVTAVAPPSTVPTAIATPAVATSPVATPAVATSAVPSVIATTVSAAAAIATAATTAIATTVATATAVTGRSPRGRRSTIVVRLTRRALPSPQVRGDVSRAWKRVIERRA